MIALYEHSVFTQGTIWQINSFGQWDVELGKVLAQRIIPELESQTEAALGHGSSTSNLIPQTQGVNFATWNDWTWKDGLPHGAPCYGILQGEDALGAIVCTGECGVQQCAAHGRPIPAFALEVTTRSGQRIWVNISTIVFEDSRLSRRLIAHLARDISDRKQVEQPEAPYA